MDENDSEWEYEYHETETEVSRVPASQIQHQLQPHH